ncbi:MAG: tRNA (adenosine(37)-N6)-dimethylallyltransferase MiaA [Clostridia bacterium]
MKKKLIAIVGPTATGKSDLAVIVGKALNAEIVSADSAQVYKGLNIGSAKISKEEQQGIPHHLLDIIGPETDYNIGMFQKDAKKAIDEITARKKIPILCGGSGLYVNSVINEGYDLSNSPTPDPESREKWMSLEKERGAGTLYSILKEKYPNRAAKIHPNDYQRILRALEMDSDTAEDQQAQWESPYDLHIYGLTIERDLLYHRIEERVDQMFSRGLSNEVSDLLDQGYRPDGNALSALGYKEVIPFLKGEISEETAKDTLKKNTRHFAKRQLTWFRRDPRIFWFDVLESGGLQSIANTIISLEKNKFM